MWFHCASLGEFEQGRPVIEEYKKQNPGTYILISFFSPSGYEIRKNYKQADKVIYLPLDTAGNARRFIDIIKPQKVIFVKYEFWYNYLHELWKKKLPVYLISANFREDQWFFRFYGSSFKKTLGYFTKLFVQNERSRKILAKNGITNVIVAGDTRFDRVAEISRQAGQADGSMKSPDILKEFKKDNSLIIAGSTWPEDEAILITYINESKTGVKWVIAPHEIDEVHIRQITGRLKRSYILYSDLNASGHSNPENYDVLIIDNIGLLSGIYAYGEIAYVGGGFGIGIHNILEPASHGMPVIFGPNFSKFQEAIDLVSLGGGLSIDSYEYFVNKLSSLLDSPAYLANTGKICFNYIQANQGATDIIVHNLLRNKFPQH